MRTNETTVNSAAFQYTVLIFDNEHSERLTTLFVHLQPSTLKWQQDKTHMSFLKEALSHPECC